MLKRAIELAKGNEEPKIGLSVQVPKSLKDDFESICKFNNVSMSSMLLSLIQVVVDDNKKRETIIKNIEYDIAQLEREKAILKNVYDKYGVEELPMEDGTIKYIKRDLDEINKKIESLENDIQNIIYDL
ncbi:MAG: hypothetical protein QG559_1050 [Campylobacterota bacterium]|nr:hypothetical protein [Campylobacterota bacterium]MDQ1264049.1 hypothetical protein [Campylobacterota bacterium]MDQ1337783.1 hypothetical protein [Campylobacterota bacterium]